MTQQDVLDTRRAQIRSELDNQNKVQTFKFAQLVSKITVSKNTDSNLVTAFQKNSVHCDLIYK